MSSTKTPIRHEPVHTPFYDVQRIEELYSEKDDVDIKYVCTTELVSRGHVYDIFYRSDGTPHPQFGNRYFGITYVDNLPYIGDADKVENLKFDTIHGIYSRHVHDYQRVPAWSCAIDGGRAYTRLIGSPDLYEVVTYIVKDGEFIEDTTKS